MFGARLAAIVKRDKKLRRTSDKDVILEHVKKVLQESDQKLILMVRG